jgi:glyoxylase-like metal-dependent hydrolase (beta-lactamase superfamily II)
MNRGMCLVTVAFCAGACSPPTPGSRFIDEVATALGGRDRVDAVRTLVLEGQGEQPNIGQNMSPEADLPVWKVTQYKRVLDLEGGRMRVQVTRVPGFLFVTPQQRQDFGVDGEVAYAIGATGMATRASDQVVWDRRAEMLHHPLTVVRAALADGARVDNLRQLNGWQAVDIIAPGGETVTLSIDPATKLPVTVMSAAYHPNLGDIIIETTFSEYQDVNGLKLPAHVVTKLDRFVRDDLRFSTQTLDARAEDAIAPDAVRTAAVPPLVPPQTVTVDEIGTGIWRLAGGSHHSVLFEFADHLTLFEVPQSEARARAVIARAKELRPGKPLTHAIVSHHHFDHTAGLRAAVAEGLTIVTHERSAAAFKEMTTRAHGAMPEALTRSPQPLKLETVSDEHTLRDAEMEVRLYHLSGNPHADTLIMAYVPRDRLLIQADVYEPAPQFTAFPFARNMAEHIRKRGLRVDRHVPIHGDMKTHEEFLKVIPAITTE